MAIPAKKGAPPGHRFGGRTAEVPNKVTLEKANEIINYARKSGQPLATDVMNEFMQLFRRKAYDVMPEPALQADGTEIETNDKASPIEFERLAGITCALATQLANYQTPKLRAIMVAAPPPPTNPDDARKRFTLSIFEGGRQAVVERKPTAGNGQHQAEVVALQDDLAGEERECDDDET